MKKFLLLAMTASALVACENQDVAEVQPLVGEKSVTISIQQVEPKTRGVTDQKGADEYAVIGSGAIFFIDNSGNNVYKRELTATEITSLANTSSTAGGKQIVITGVPSTATTLFFLANAMTAAHPSYPAIEGTTSADSRLRIDKLQADPIYVPMAGQSTSFTSVGTNLYTASVTISPLVARVEVGQITYQNQNGASAPAIGADIKEYKLAGVFVNNVRPYVLLGGIPYLAGTPIDIRAQVGWATGWESYFNATNEAFPYFIGGSPSAPSDWVAKSMVTFCSPTGAAALSFYPDVNNGATSTDPVLTPKKAWAFQVCPSTTVTSGQAYDLPHLILKLTNVAYQANPFGEPVKYITITKYKTTAGVAITQFERGNVYRISNLTFSHTETTNQPYEENITVTATVSVIPWVINNIVPDWN